MTLEKNGSVSGSHFSHLRHSRHEEPSAVSLYVKNDISMQNPSCISGAQQVGQQNSYNSKSVTYLLSIRSEVGSKELRKEFGKH